jgi:hypothetical protein
MATASALPSKEEQAAAGPFIWRQIVKRARSWYVHDAKGVLQRDPATMRWLPSPQAPLPELDPMDKYAIRQYLDKLGTPQPKLLHVIREPRELLAVEGTLPKIGWVVKPAGAAYSDGVIVVHNGVMLNLGMKPLDVQAIVDELEKLAGYGGRGAQLSNVTKEGASETKWNMSCYLVEELVLDSEGGMPPTDYKFFMMGGKVLWCWLHYYVKGQKHPMKASVDANWNILPGTFNESVCERQKATSGDFAYWDFEITTDVKRLPPKPACWGDMLKATELLGSQLNVFVRLDWYADKSLGPILGEVTLMPSSGSPADLFAGWANAVTKAAWIGVDGCDLLVC